VHRIFTSRIARPLGLALLSALAAAGQGQSPNGDPRIAAGETVGVINVAVRGNYVVPSTMTVEEGVYLIRIDDPFRVAPGSEVTVDTEGGQRVRSKVAETNGPRTKLLVRLGRGKHKIKIGAKNEWVIDVDVVQAKKP